MPEPVLLFLVCLFSAGLIMFLTWLAALRLDNAGIVDVSWSAGFLILSAIVLCLGSGWFVRRALFSAVVSIWSTRLSMHLILRVRNMWPQEDPRYKRFKEDCRGSVSANLLLVFLFQGLIMVILMLPIFIASVNRSEVLSPLELGGFLLGLLSVAGEALADKQLAEFKEGSPDRNAVCRKGLWNYSRHPNYFFEWLFWSGIFVAASGSPGAVYTGFVPLLFLHILFNVTGVKPSEEQSCRVRGEAYRVYQEETSVFVPWFKRKKG